MFSSSSSSSSYGSAASVYDTRRKGGKDISRDRARERTPTCGRYQGRTPSFRPDNKDQIEVAIPGGDLDRDVCTYVPCDLRNQSSCMRRPDEPCSSRSGRPEEPLGSLRRWPPLRAGVQPKPEPWKKQRDASHSRFQAKSRPGIPASLSASRSTSPSENVPTTSARYILALHAVLPPFIFRQQCLRVDDPESLRQERPFTQGLYSITCALPYGRERMEYERIILSYRIGSDQKARRQSLDGAPFCWDLYIAAIPS